jgi:hypothetical protein
MKSHIPSHRLQIRPEKSEKFRVHFTCGGDRIEYPGKVATKTADIVTANILFNSVLSKKDTHFMMIDNSNFYLNTRMPRYEYMRIPVSANPNIIMEQYQLASLVHNGFVMVEIRKGMYRLPQAGLIANERLVKYLATYGFHPTKHTHGLFTHESRPVSFCLVVDDFGVKYVGKEHAKHLVDALESLYDITTENDPANDTLRSPYNGTTTNALSTFPCPATSKRPLTSFSMSHLHAHNTAPHAWSKPTYGSGSQLTKEADTTARLDAAGLTRLQQVVGTLLYYARAVDSTMLAAIGDISSAMSEGTEATAQDLTQLLNYAATHPDATVQFIASNMQLHIHSDASYISVIKACSRAAGMHPLSQ